MIAFENPRWEDYDYVTFHRNRFAYYGDGWTEVEKAGGEGIISYMDSIDYPPVPNLDKEVDTTKVANGNVAGISITVSAAN